MSINAVAWAMKQELPAITKMVLITLADHHNGETGQCNPTVRRIARLAGVAERTAETHLKKLAELEPRRPGGVPEAYIDVEETRRADGSRTSNQYNLLLGDGTHSPGSETHTARGATNTPGSEIDAYQEPGIEPRKEPGIEETEETKETEVSLSKKKPKRVTEVTDVFREQMVQRFGPVLGDTIQEQIDEALGHQSATKWNDMQAYVRGWLRRSEETVLSRSPPTKEDRRDKFLQDYQRRWGNQ